MIHITDAIVLDDREITERFVRATGPGGQNVNKDATAVELRIDIGRSSLPPDLRERLIALAGRHVTTDGVLVVVSRVHRSQAPTAREMRLVSKERQARSNALGVGEATISGPGAA